MANITQFARQHSKKNVFISHFSEDLEDRLEMSDFYGGGEAVAEERTRRSIKKKKTRHEVTLSLKYLAEPLAKSLMKPLKNP
jgi:hypothetical protein